MSSLESLMLVIKKVLRFVEEVAKAPHGITDFLTLRFEEYPQNVVFLSVLLCPNSSI